MIAAALQVDTPAAAGAVPYSQSSNALPGIHTRVIDAQGGGGDRPGGRRTWRSRGRAGPAPAGPECGRAGDGRRAAGRPEIAQARQGQPATAIRQVGRRPAGRRVLYAAAPVLAGDGSVARSSTWRRPCRIPGWRALPEGVRWQFGGVILAAFLLAGGGRLLLLARRIARPLAQLVEAAHAVAGGDLGQSVPEDPAIASWRSWARPSTA